LFTPSAKFNQFPVRPNYIKM